MCSITYQDNSYLVYSIRRDKDNANVFVSKLVKGSLGYLIIDDFSNGEKEVIDGVVKRIINKESKETIEGDGFIIVNDIKKFYKSIRYLQEKDISEERVILQKLPKDKITWY